jgi:hypothetical protein
MHYQNVTKITAKQLTYGGFFFWPSEYGGSG